jgi:DNA mismatch endonuclease (patch repair protein)
MSWPAASSAEVRRRMQSQASWNTKPELVLRRELHRLGLRYYIHRRPVPGLRRQADVVFPRVKVAVFVDSCFWHGCPEHASWPKSNAQWWRDKIEMTRARDRDTDQRLREAGWLPVRIWEHECLEDAAGRVAAEVRVRQRRC